ncbi:MAG: DUF5675 family protein [Alphaproteobacteria bacterium]|nr:DUF5675 family protein [Alphaproteobacteria bacterium]
MIHATLQRAHSSADVTLGMMQVHDAKHPPLYTLENPWKENKRNVSCIPAGVYTCVKHHGKKYKDVWRLENVKDRSAILIHAGNTASDTEGCILVGMVAGEYKQNPAVLHSRDAIEKLQNIFGDAPFTLEVIDV